MEYLSQTGFQLVLQKWSEYDPNIKSFGWGSLYAYNGEPKAKQLYKGVWCQPQSTTVDEWAITRTYQVLIYDVIYENEGGDNSNLVISDCEEIAFRLIRFLKSKSEIFDIDGIPSINPFRDKFLDDVAGVIINLSVNFNGESSNCEDPNYDFVFQKNNV